jgi:hypothetical protein
MVHAALLSSRRRTTALGINLSPLYLITVQQLIHVREFQKHSTVPLIWNSYFKNPDTSADEENRLQFLKLGCHYLPVCITKK